MTAALVFVSPCCILTSERLRGHSLRPASSHPLAHLLQAPCPTLSPADTFLSVHAATNFVCLSCWQPIRRVSHRVASLNKRTDQWPRRDGSTWYGPDTYDASSPSLFVQRKTAIRHASNQRRQMLFLDSVRTSERHGNACGVMDHACSFFATPWLFSEPCPSRAHFKIYSRSNWTSAPH